MEDNYEVGILWSGFRFMFQTKGILVEYDKMTVYVSFNISCIWLDYHFKGPASAKIPHFCINLTSNSAEKAHWVGVGCGLKTAVAMK